MVVSREITDLPRKPASKGKTGSENVSIDLNSTVTATARLGLAHLRGRIMTVLDRIRFIIEFPLGSFEVLPLCYELMLPLAFSSAHALGFSGSRLPGITRFSFSES